jgi:hypothetical protein
MRNKRFRLSDRRQNSDIPNAPFKESNGATKMKCHRNIPDRRINNIQAEWVNEIVIN